ncbi:MAG: hypothetical protein JWO80_6418 [Bryobacterales bacterium]|nr:hypothetical protein [Bryobacterales bacterium]
MRKLIVLLCLAGPGVAAINNVSVAGVTATQALLKYTAPDPAACNVEVSESSTYRPLVNDVDPAKFGGASSDARPGSIQNGSERLVTLGKRAAEVGLDTVRYSRALQAYTTHYFRITCQSTGETATGQFQTANVLFGIGYAEAQAIDPNQPGSYALPTLSLTDRTQEVVDPQTGVLIKRWIMPRDSLLDINGFPLSIARSSTWNSLGNLAQPDGNGATVSGNTGALFLAMAANAPYANSFTDSASAYQGVANSAFGYFQAHLIAAVNPNGTAPANPEDAKIVACLTIDGANCYPGGSQYEAALTTSFSDQPFGSTSSVDLWQQTPGTKLPNWTQEWVHSGSSMCDGTTVVQSAGGAPYGVFWTAGSSFTINNTNYTIAAVNHTAQLTLTSNCPSMIAGSGAFKLNDRLFQTPVDTFSSTDYGRTVFVYGAGPGGSSYVSVIDQVVDARTAVFRDSPSVTGVNTQFGYPAPSYAYNFGVLVRKKTPSSDTIAIDYASVNYEFNFFFLWTLGGGTELCSVGTVTGASGRPGYNCLMPVGGYLYWIDAESGETHQFGSINTNPNAGCTFINPIFDSIDPDKFYCGGTGTLYVAKYYGNHAESYQGTTAGTIPLFSGLNACNTSPPNKAPYKSQQPCIVVQPLMAGTDIPTLTEAFTANPVYAPAFDKTKFRGLQMKSIDPGGNVFMTVYRSSNNSIGWDIIFNPNATSNSEGGTSSGPVGNHGCVGNGNPGCVVAAAPGWIRPGCRWCTIKGGETMATGWVETDTYPWINSGAGTGPYYVSVVDGTANGTVNSVDGSASLQNCPPNTYGAAGKNCTSLTVASEPLSPAHGDGETGLPGELGPALPGDIFQFELQGGAGNTEQMRLIKKVPGAQAGTWVYTLWRDVNHLRAGGHGYYTSGPNPNLYTVCGANQDPSNQYAGYGWLWNFAADPHGMNADGTTIPADNSSVNDHLFWSNGAWGAAQQGWNETRCAPGTLCYSMRVPNGRPISRVISDLPASGTSPKHPVFAGGASDGINIQSHPTGGGVAAGPDRANYMFDGRPDRGGQTSGSVNGPGDHPGTVVGGQLYKFPATSMPNINLPFRKIVPTKAFTGNLPLVDISSPATGDVIGTTPADSYKYCVAAAANECRVGSSPGDTYVNAPYVRYPYCYWAAQNLNFPDEYDICVAGSSVEQDGIFQIEMDKVDNVGQYQRLITKFNHARQMSPFYTPYVLPNGRWMGFESNFPGDGSVNKTVLLVKLPPPGPGDSVNRMNFIPMPITLPAMNGATNAIVRFGYAENGAPGSLFCTSRKESCVVGTQGTTSAVDPVNPFYFEQVEAGSWQGVPCASGCTITIPGIPQRMLYYQYAYRSNSGVVYTSPMSVLATP